MSDSEAKLFLEIEGGAEKAASGVEQLKTSLQQLQGVVDSFSAAKIGSQFQAIAESMKGLVGTLSSKDMERFTESMANVAIAFKPLESLDKNKIAQTIGALERLPELTEKLEDVNLERFTTQIKELANIMKPLAVEMEKIGKGFAALPKSVDKSASSLENFSTKNKTLGSALTMTRVKLYALSRFLGAAVAQSNAYIENLNLFELSMRDNFDDALEYAMKVKDAFAIDPSEWIRFQGIFQNMLTGFGIVSDDAAIMSKTLTQLGYDLSTLFNVNYEVAMQKLQSGIAGQPRPMREWGFDMSESTLKLTALNMGIKENVENMTQFEKSQLRFVQIMQTANKLGVLQNFSRELITPANAIRILKQQVVQLTRAIGNMFIPILMAVIPYVQAVVQVLTEAAHYIANLLGFKLPKLDYSGVDYGAGLFEDLNDGIGETEDNFGGATAAAKRFQSVLAGFDEINILQQPILSSGSGVGGLPGTGGIGEPIDLGIDFDKYTYDFLGGASNEVKKIVDNIKRILTPFFGWIADNFDVLKGLVIGIGAIIAAWEIWKLFTAASVPVTLALTLTGIALGIAGLSNIIAGRGELMDYVMTAIGYGLGIAAPLAAFGLTATGISIAIAAVLAITIGGIALGYKKKRQALVEEAFSKGDTLFSDIANAFEVSMNEITVNFNPHIETANMIEDLTRDLDQQALKIQGFFDALNEGLEPTVENVSGLLDDLKGYLDIEKSVSDTAFEGIIGDIVRIGTESEESGKKLASLFYLGKAEGDERRAELYRELDEIQKAVNEGTKDLESAEQESLAIWAQMRETTGSAADDIKINLLGVSETLKSVNWETAPEFKENINLIAEAFASTRELIEADMIAMETSYDAFVRSVHDPALQEELIRNKGKFLDEYRADLENEVKSNGEILAGIIKTDFSDKIMAGLTNLIDEGATPQMINDFIKDIDEMYLSPLMKDLQPLFDEFGIEGASGLAEAVLEIQSAYGQLFSKSQTSGLMRAGYTKVEIAEMQATAQSYFDEVLVDLLQILGGFAEEGGAGANEAAREIIEGLTTGYTENSENPYNALREVFVKLQTGTLEGKEDLRGLMNLLPADLAASLRGNEDVLLQSWYEVLSGFTGSFSDLIAEIDRMIRNTRLPAFQVGLNVSGQGAIHGGIHMLYATGGFPDEGEMFIAREAGPELVGRIGGRTAVANNDQIVSSVSKGVYDAVTSAMRGGSGGESGDIILKVGEAEFGRIAAGAIRQASRQAGKVLIEV